jgi:hypothetical protein
MINRSAAVGWPLSVLLYLGTASAQPAPGEPSMPGSRAEPRASTSDETAALAYEPVYTPAPDPVPYEAPAPSRLHLKMFASIDTGVPILLDVDRNLIRPGGNLHLQGGLDIGYVAFFLHSGWRGIPVDFDRAAKHGHPEYEGEGRDPLKNPYFGFGLRGQIPNRSPLLPYLSASFDFNFWNFRESAVACGGGYYYWYCNDYNVYKFTPGFSGRLGTAIDVARGVYLDLGVGMSMSFEGDFFDNNEVWLEPFMGVGYRG